MKPEDITEDFIKSVAKNACLTLSSEEISLFKKDFVDILALFDELASAPAAKNPSFHPIPVANSIREDEVIPTTGAVAPAKDIVDGYVRGPKII